MNNASFRNIAACALAVLIARAGFADSSPQAVQAEFDRCAAQMERVVRALKDYETNVSQLAAALRNASPAIRERLTPGLSALENRTEYFRNRTERASGQADKIRDDIKNVSGPTCPSCVTSAVNLYCRSAETLASELDTYTDKASDLRNSLRENASAAASVPHDAFVARAATLDSALTRAKPGIDSCTDKAAAVLYRQATLNATRADSLTVAERFDDAGKALDAAEILLRKARAACGAAR